MTEPVAMLTTWIPVSQQALDDSPLVQASVEYALLHERPTLTTVERITGWCHWTASNGVQIRASLWAGARNCAPSSGHASRAKLSRTTPRTTADEDPRRLGDDRMRTRGDWLFVALASVMALLSGLAWR